MSDIADKIRKLLAVAECDGASEAERATALDQAARLAQKHAIDLDALGSEASEYGSTQLWEAASQPPWITAIMFILGDHFNVKPFRQGRGDLGYVAFHVFGCKPSREMAEYVFTFLRREFLRLARVNRLARTEGTFRSMGLGLRRALRAKEKQRTASEQSDALILCDKLNAAFDEQNPEMPSAKFRAANASTKAYEIGKHIEINKP